MSLMFVFFISAAISVNILGVEVERGFHLAGVGVTDLHCIAIRRHHVEIRQSAAAGTVTIIRTGSDAKCREKQAHEDAQLSD